MKDQYFGDINDYRKYGLLRAIIRSSGVRLLVAKRFNFIQRMLEALKSATAGSFMEAFSTPHVVFLVGLQPKHQRFHEAIVSLVQEGWQGQIQHWELTFAQQGAPADRSPAARARVG